MSFIKLFKEVIRSDLDKVGYKGLNISILSNEDFNVPLGFIITTEAFEYFIEKSGLRQKIDSLLSKVDETNIEKISHEIGKLIEDTPLPNKIEEQIIEAYESLGFELNRLKITDLLNIKHSPLVAVRSSYTEKMDDEIVKQLTVLNTKGKNNLIGSIKKCWASSYDKNLILYRSKSNLEKESKNAVIIQKMVDAESSGICFSSNPEKRKKSEILVKACFGLGEKIKDTLCDSYIVNKDTLEVKDIEVNEQEFSITMDHAQGAIIKKFLKERARLQKLNNKLISEVARITKRIAEHFEKDQIVEWSISKEKIFILQSKDLEIEFADEGIKQEEKEEKKTVDIYEPTLENDFKVLDEMESEEESKVKTGFETFDSKEKVSEIVVSNEPDEDSVPEKTEEEIREVEEKRTEKDFYDFTEKVKEKNEEHIPTVDELEEFDDVKDDQEEPKITEDIVEEKEESSFDLIKELTRKMEQQFNDDDIEGYEETRKELKRTLEEL